MRYLRRPCCHRALRRRGVGILGRMLRERGLSVRIPWRQTADPVLTQCNSDVLLWRRGSVFWSVSEGDHGGLSGIQVRGYCGRGLSGYCTVFEDLRSDGMKWSMLIWLRLLTVGLRCASLLGKVLPTYASPTHICCDIEHAARHEGAMMTTVLFPWLLVLHG